MLCIVGAVFSPFYFYWRYSDYGDYTGLAALGPVGDFVGGTTVTFFTASSVFLLIATNIMQREELKASVEQAKLARTETKITNETMKKQQFETTFFNVLSLHHQIADGIKVNLSESKGHPLIENKITYSCREEISELRDICKRYIAVVSDAEYSHNTPKVYIDNFFEHSTIEHEQLDKLYKSFQEKY